MFQTRREKILEARNKEIRLKEKTKVRKYLGKKQFSVRIVAGHAWAWRPWWEENWRFFPSSSSSFSHHSTHNSKTLYSADV